MITFFVPGKPIPQGSLKHIGGGRLIHAHSKELMAWRDAIAWYAKAAGVRPTPDPIGLSLHFVIIKPKSVKRQYPTVPSDLDKNIRSCLDALSGIAYNDDAQVVDIVSSKRYGENVGVSISIWSLTCP
jgi:crossover junction endodeoxyribonuclease RusA